MTTPLDKLGFGLGWCMGVWTCGNELKDMFILGLKVQSNPLLTFSMWYVTSLIFFVLMGENCYAYNFHFYYYITYTMSYVLDRDLLSFD